MLVLGLQKRVIKNYSTSFFMARLSYVKKCILTMTILMKYIENLSLQYMYIYIYTHTNLIEWKRTNRERKYKEKFNRDTWWQEGNIICRQTVPIYEKRIVKKKEKLLSSRNYAKIIHVYIIKITRYLVNVHIISYYIVFSRI